MTCTTTRFGLGNHPALSLDDFDQARNGAFFLDAGCELQMKSNESTNEATGAIHPSSKLQTESKDTWVRDSSVALPKFVRRPRHGEKVHRARVQTTRLLISIENHHSLYKRNENVTHTLPIKVDRANEGTHRRGHVHAAIGRRGGGVRSVNGLQRRRTTQTDDNATNGAVGGHSLVSTSGRH